MSSKFKEDILRLRRERKTYKEIRSILKCTMSVISYHCKNENLENSNIHLKPTEEDIKKFNQLYQEGNTLAEVAKLVNRSTHGISKYIKDKRKKSKTITASKSVISWRRRRKLDLISYKGGKCECCGYNRCAEALQFHHLNPKEKEFTIGGKSWSFERLKKEADKCILVCGNCHVEIHNKIRLIGEIGITSDC